MDHFDPGSSNTSLLRLQQSHVSRYVWDDEEITFRARCNFWQSLPHERVLQLICNTAFGPNLEIGSVEINNHLLRVMVERWTSETHTFHFPKGECTITLEDVAYQLGLPIDGKAIISVLGVSLERENCRLGERGSPGRVKSWAILKDSRLSENCLA
ncbi:hypothetical protein Lal_00039257 [Lupinus albus]|nr:hypothetical protein Lal_00039257 [Lupinus albus]